MNLYEDIDNENQIVENILTEEGQAGFDVTDMHLSYWKKLFAFLKLDPDKFKPRKSGKPFVWKGSGITFVTTNNPFTGEYYIDGKRQPEEGYASYIGIKGNEDKVKHAFDYIEKYGNYKDSEYGQLSFINEDKKLWNTQENIKNENRKTTIGAIRRPWK